MSAKDIFVKCDELDGLPEPNRRNYLFESKMLEQVLPPKAHVLQIGSMDGVRFIRLAEKRPDLQWEGLEIEPELVDLARENVAKAGVDAKFTVGDVSHPPAMGEFDWVVCLNHTLGYIEDEAAAIGAMKRLGKQVVVSVYGEEFDNALAKAYFGVLGLDDYSDVRRYSREDVENWGGNIIETPIGYWVVISGVGSV